MGGATDLEWNRRSAAESSGKRWSAAELDWIWVRRWFEYGLEENKLESSADEWIGWEEAPSIWGCECVGLWGFVGALGSEGFVGLRRRCGINDLRVFFREAATSKWSREVEKQTWERRKAEKEKRRKKEKAWEWFNFLFIYKTCLTGNQKSLKLHQRTRSKP